MCIYRLYVLIYAWALAYVNIYIHVYIYIFVFVYIHTYIHIYISIHMFFHTMYVCIYLSVYAWIYLNSLITYVNTNTNTQTLLFILQCLLTKNLARTVIQLLTYIFKNHSVTDWKSRRKMLQIGLMLSEIPWVCLSCRDLHRPFKFVIKAVWNKKMRFCSWRQTKGQSVWVCTKPCIDGAITRFKLETFGLGNRALPDSPLNQFQGLYLLVPRLWSRSVIS